MNNIEISVYLPEQKYNALKSALAEDGTTVEDKLNEMVKFLYEQFVPIEQQTVIEADIREQEARERAEAEAKRRFSIIHIRENGNDSYLTNDHFNSFLSVAYRYRLYSRGELSSKPYTLDKAFLESAQFTEQEYKQLCEDMPEDIRITALIDIDADNGTLNICERGDEVHRTYSLHDVSVAAYKAFRAEYISSDARQRLFYGALSGKEIVSDDESVSESESPTMRM